MAHPNFFIVGAPKSATTAIDNYLSGHDEIFMASKESHHFARDLLPDGDKALPSNYYARLFKNATSEKIVGESSVFYLLSRSAAADIHAFSPSAKILILLRDPVTMIPSLFAQNAYDGYESATCLEAALEQEAARAGSAADLPGGRIGRRLLYHEVASYVPQVTRFLDVFGSEAVHITIYEDFVASPQTEFKKILGFLAVDDIYEPEFKVINKYKEARYPWISRLLFRPPALLRHLRGKFGPPTGLERRVQATLDKFNRRHSSPPGKNPDTMRQLREEFAQEKRSLEIILGRSLDRWH